jgi:hypothetical protein
MGQGFPDRPAGEKSRYDPDQEMPDPEQVGREIKDTEKRHLATTWDEGKRLPSDSG